MGMHKILQPSKITTYANSSEKKESILVTKIALTIIVKKTVNPSRANIKYLTLLCKKVSLLYSITKAQPAPKIHVNTNKAWEAQTITVSHISFICS